MYEFKGKRILLLYARFFEYDKIVKAKLEELGAIVDLFDARANINTVEKALLKVTDKFYTKKQIKFHLGICLSNKSKEYDYIFTNENLNEDVINNYRKYFKTAKMILYLDDSVENLRNVNRTFSLYDRVLSFDSEDSIKYNIKFRPLFYNDLIKDSKDVDFKTNKDLCFVGTAHSDRVLIINKLLEQIDSTRVYLYLYLQSWFMYFYYFFKNKEYRRYKFNFFKYKQIDMKQVVNIMNDSKVIIDIQHPKQSGLTMRTIETLGLGKKLITTNKAIEKYDFYNKNNIYIIDRENPIIDKAFIELPYKELEPNIYQKYGMEAWLIDVFM